MGTPLICLPRGQTGPLLQQLTDPRTQGQGQGHSRGCPDVSVCVVVGQGHSRRLTLVIHTSAFSLPEAQTLGVGGGGSGARPFPQDRAKIPAPSPALECWRYPHARLGRAAKVGGRAVVEGETRGWALSRKKQMVPQTFFAEDHKDPERSESRETGGFTPSPHPSPAFPPQQKTEHCFVCGTSASRWRCKCRKLRETEVALHKEAEARNFPETTRGALGRWERGAPT